MLTDDVTLVDCAGPGCGRIMLGESTLAAYRDGSLTPPIPDIVVNVDRLAGRVDGRPYCRRCIRAARERQDANRRRQVQDLYETMELARLDAWRLK